ncbi:ComEC/Rec2 family competence protein [Roseovarius carneus]|uniref:ComEC/Rec2 family competence protein n=1 Tax=Roseovarius carneus TaxID=2853164 RepID=UPI001CCBACCC|nr:ComEC/Rec2 family competence protein [Roseovarius carneus]
MSALWGHLATALLVQRGHLFGWTPVCVGIGIGVFFSLGFEPSVMALWGIAGAGGLAVIMARLVGAAFGPLFIGMALIAAGMVLGGWRAQSVSGPVLGWHYYGPVEGRVVNIDRSGSDAVRVTLDQVVLRDMRPGRTPTRVRISLHGKEGGVAPRAGARVMTTAHLSPPSGPTEPGGFDFQRHAWFLKIGGVGYTRVPLMALEPPDGKRPLFAIRMWLSERVQANLPGEAGAFAAAIMTGDRSGMGQDTIEALRVSNLAHLLAISGLHMGLLAGFVFAALRYGFAAIPWLALRVQVKPWAAGLALIIAAMYLGLSGGSIATERAFIMVAVVLVAVMLNRRAFSLRAVALAALIVLFLRPEALTGPGFQMSFAATTALIAVFAMMRDYNLPPGPRWLKPVAAVFISSFIAGIATAPIAAAHFNQFAHYGLIANLASVPLMGSLVMPAAVLAVCLLPLGLDWIGLWIMGLGLDWILAVAHWTAGLEGARGTVVTPGPVVLPMLAMGALFMVLWQGRARLLGAVPALFAMLLWTQAERPDVLIADTGGLVGVMTPEGRALSAPRGGGFVAMTWLENDGDKAEQIAAAARWPEAAALGGVEVRNIRGKKAAAELSGCAKTDILVFNTPPPEGLDCTVIDPASLRQTGAIALYEDAEGLKTITARDITGARLWNSWKVRRDRAGPRDAQ